MLMGKQSGPRNLSVILRCPLSIKWGSTVMDTLGPAILPFIERLSSLRRLKCTSIIEKGPQSVSFIVASFIQSVLYQKNLPTYLCTYILEP